MLDVLSQASSPNSIPSNSLVSSQNEPLEDLGRLEMSNCLYSAFNSEVSSFSASTSTLGLGTPSQDKADDPIAVLEAELTVLRAQIDADEEEQSEYDDFDDFDASSHIAPQHVVASSQNQCLSSHTSTHSLYASIEPILELTSDIINSEKNTVTSTPDLEILSQDIADDRIAALEAELAALQAQTSSDEEEQPQYDDSDDFISSTDLALGKEEFTLASFSPFSSFSTNKDAKGSKEPKDWRCCLPLLGSLWSLLITFPSLFFLIKYFQRAAKDRKKYFGSL